MVRQFLDLVHNWRFGSPDYVSDGRETEVALSTKLRWVGGWVGIFDWTWILGGLDSC